MSFAFAGHDKAAELARNKAKAVAHQIPQRGYLL